MVLRRHQDVDTKTTNPLLEIPVAPPKKWARWASEDCEGPKLDAVYKCLRGLRDAGLTGQMVAKDFTRQIGRASCRERVYVLV